MPVDKYWSNYRLETKEGGDLTLNSDQQFNVYSGADSSIEISSGDFTLEAPDGNLTIGIQNTGSYSDKELKLQAHGGSLRMHYHVGCRFAYTGYSHYFTASNQNEEGYRFTYAHNDEDTEYAFIITRNDGNAPRFIMDNTGKIEYEGTFRLSGSGGPGDGKFLVSDAQGDATWQDFHNVVDLGHLENIDYSDGGTIEINSGHFIIDAINVEDPSEPTLDGFIEIKSAASVRLAYQGTDGESTYLWLQDDYQCKVQGPGNSMTEGLLLVECRSDSPQHIGVEVELSQFAEPGSRWMDFQDWDNNSKGCIQMAGVVLPGTTGSELYAWPSETPYGFVYADYDSAGNDAYTSEGNARFISGNADFGEFFEAGDIEEWPERAEISSKSPLDRASLLGIAEGLVVWVRGRKFYKNMMDNNCIPMFVTKRSIVTGDGSTLLGGSTREIFGEVLSFCGKLPVFVKGAASCGDYLVPAEGKNYCYAVSYDDISFQEYKKAMGRALESCEEMKVLREDHPHAPGEETAFSIILCAVGIK